MYVAENFVLNNRGYGELGQIIENVRFEPGMMRPFKDRAYPGDRFVTVNVGRDWDATKNTWKAIQETLTVKEAERRFDCEVPISNAMTLQKDIWIEIDRRVVKATRSRPRLYADIAAANTRNVNGMGKTTVEYQARTDFGEARQDMDGASDTRADRPMWNLKSMPLPVTHMGAQFTQREIASSGGGEGLDLSAIEMGGFRVGELIEKVTIGTETGVTFGPSSSSDSRYTGSSVVYGATNFPYRVTKTDLHSPAAANPEQVLEDVIEMLETMETNGFYGDNFVLYHSTPYGRFLRDDYFRSGSTATSRTLRARLLEAGVADIRRLDYLTSGYVLLLVDVTNAQVVEAVNGMAVTTVQWPSKGGLIQHIEVMAIQAAIWKSPANGVAGLIHGTTS